jgi:hypothetical protein
MKTIVAAIILLFAFNSFAQEQNQLKELQVDFRIMSELKLKNEKVAVVKVAKDKTYELKLGLIRNKKCSVIPMSRNLEKNVNYELDKLKITDNYTIIEVFRREAGVNSSIGFLFSSDLNKNFKYIDFKEIYKDAECIEKVQFNSKDNSITVSLISLYPSEKFISLDYGCSWKLLNK